jgi:hypothetical protein
MPTDDAELLAAVRAGDTVAYGAPRRQRRVPDAAPPGGG